jgi:hypothetical protein
MAEISSTVEVHLDIPSEDAFKWVIEADNLVYWMEGVRRSEWIRRQERPIPRPQDTWSMLYEYGGKENDIVMEVDVCDPRDGVFEFHTIEGNYPIRTQYRCQPSAAGTLFRMTRTAFSDSIFTSIMFVLTGFISKPMMRKQNQKELEKMKAVIEVQIPAIRS